MSVDLSVQLSAGSVCRSLAGELARRFVELAGGTASEAESLGRAVDAAAEAVAHPSVPIDVTFARSAAGVDVEVACSGSRRHCHATLTRR